MRRPSLTRKIAESLSICAAHLLQDVQRADAQDRDHLNRGVKFLEDLIAHKRFETSQGLDDGDG